MKRFVVMALFLIAGIAFGQDYYPVSAPTVEWDAAAGSTLPGDVVEYEVYLWDDINPGEMHDQPLGLLTLHKTVTVNSAVLDIPYRSIWRVGVRQKHTDGGSNVTFSSMIYSSRGVDCLAGVPLAYVPGTVWLPVNGDPTSLRDSGTP